MTSGVKINELLRKGKEKSLTITPRRNHFEHQLVLWEEAAAGRLEEHPEDPEDEEGEETAGVEVVVVIKVPPAATKGGVADFT